MFLRFFWWFSTVLLFKIKRRAEEIDVSTPTSPRYTQKEVPLLGIPRMKFLSRVYPEKSSSPGYIQKEVPGPNTPEISKPSSKSSSKSLTQSSLAPTQPATAEELEPPRQPPDSRVTPFTSRCTDNAKRKPNRGIDADGKRWATKGLFIRNRTPLVRVCKIFGGFRETTHRCRYWRDSFWVAPLLIICWVLRHNPRLPILAG